MARTDLQRVKRSRLLVVLLIAVIAVIGWRIYSYEPIATARQLGGEIAAAQKDGLYTNLRDLPPAHVPVYGNAADIYRQIVSEATGKNWDRIADVAIAVRSRQPADVAKARGSRPLIEPTVRELEEGAQMPYLDFGRDPTLGYRTTFGPERVLVSLASVLRWDAEQAIARHDVEAALAKAEVIAHIARQMDDEQYFTVVGLRAHVLVDLFQVLEPVLYTSGRLPSVRLRIRQVLDETGPAPDYRLVLARELPSALDSVDHADVAAWKTAAPQFAVFDSVASSAKFSVFRDAYKVRLIQLWRAVFAKLPKRSSDLYGVQTALYDAQAAQENNKEFSYTLSKLLYDEYTSDVSAFNGSEARMLLLRAALDWIEGKRDLPIDPDSGKPLLHKVLPSGEVLYSVGPDEKDDGASTQLGEGGLPIDIVVRLPKG